MQGSATSRVVNHANNNNLVKVDGHGEMRSETWSKSKHYSSSMFVESYSAVLSSLKKNSKKNKLKHIHAVSHRVVPSGPNPLHN
ncbi:hypothetical protein HN51_071631 [Arachis hypogaea]|uniref:Uncharacterized protein n=1 Tax=Arachis hypogaea TaxID=3818 RepID=A0A444YXT8_ARAHY|nr:hypothetical protein Ahy_B05g074017 [Arachis hypogaea]